MNQFESVKAAVTLRQAAENYGLTVSRNGMTCCPFHEDRHPSMKLNEDYFFCFGCHAQTGCRTLWAAGTADRYDLLPIPRGQASKHEAE